MLQTSVAGIALECCVYNASGPRSGSVEALGKIGKSRAGAVLSKSATLLSQDGNPHPRYKELDLGPRCAAGSINSEGLPNKGIDYYLTDDAVNTGLSNDKPYIVSISGLSLKDNLEMLDRATKIENVAAIELNLACPNIPGKPTVAYDFQQMQDILKAVEKSGAFKKKTVGIKLAPYFDMPHFQQAADILNAFPVGFVVCTNTIGNGLIIDAEAEQPLIAPKGGFGGLAGGYIKQVALANVRQMRQRLREDIDVIGVGGVHTGTDAFELILCGASAVQVGTCHWSEGSTCFDRIAGELEELMERKGYRAISEFRGKLRDFDKTKATKATKKSPATAASGSGDLSLVNIGMLLANMVFFAWMVLQTGGIKAFIEGLKK